jgi:hypothetical protein
MSIQLPDRLRRVASDQQSPLARKISVLVVYDDVDLLMTNLRKQEFLGYQGI